MLCYFVYITRSSAKCKPFTQFLSSTRKSVTLSIFSLLRSNNTSIVKDQRKGTHNSSNYRPIIIFSSILKLFEQHIFIFLEDKIKINILQFVYIEHMSTIDVCILLIKVIHKKNFFLQT